MEAPQLSIVIPAREGLAELEPVLAALEPQLADVPGEVVVVGGPPARPGAECVRLIPTDDRDLLRLRLRGIHEARGEIVAIGEDHAVPARDWCRAVLRAHTEHPEKAAVVGALANATDRTAVGRGNFLAFASPWQPPLDRARADRPPPCSALSFKREALAGLGRPGELEASLLLRLHASGEIVPDGRVLLEHYQDHGIRWSMANGFHASRSSYGYARAWMSRSDRVRAAFGAIPNILVGFVGEAWRARRREPGPVRDLAVVALVALGTALGGFFGALLGRGRSPELTA